MQFNILWWERCNHVKCYRTAAPLTAWDNPCEWDCFPHLDPYPSSYLPPDATFYCHPAPCPPSCSKVFSHSASLLLPPSPTWILLVTVTIFCSPAAVDHSAQETWETPLPEWLWHFVPPLGVLLSLLLLRTCFIHLLPLLQAQLLPPCVWLTQLPSPPTWA